MNRFEKATCVVPCNTTVFALEEQLKVHYSTSEESGVICLEQPGNITPLIEKGIIKSCIFVLEYGSKTWSSLRDVDNFLFALGEHQKKEHGGIFIFESLLWNIYNSAYAKNLFYTSRFTGNPLTSANMLKNAIQDNAVLEINIVSDLTNAAAVLDNATAYYMLTQKLAIEVDEELEHCSKDKHKECDKFDDACLKKLCCKVEALQRTIAYIIILGAMCACVLVYFFFNSFMGAKTKVEV